MDFHLETTILAFIVLQPVMCPCMPHFSSNDTYLYIQQSYSSSPAYLKNLLVERKCAM